MVSNSIIKTSRYRSFSDLNASAKEESQTSVVTVETILYREDNLEPIFFG